MCALVGWSVIVWNQAFAQQKYQQQQSLTHVPTHVANAVLPAYDFTPIEQLLRDSLKRFDGGCSLLLMHNGRVIYEKNFGTINADTIIPIASGSKWLASALLMTFIDEGKLSLRDPVSKYLQYLMGTKATITVQQLFAHTSGYAGEMSVMRDMKITMKEAAYRISSEPLQYIPGTRFAYGGASMQLGGRIMEIIGEKSFEELFQERIAQPLGMTKTSFYGLGKTQNPLLAGGAKSSAREYARFLQMLMNKGVWQGKRMLSEEAIAEMHSNQAGRVPVLRRLQSTSANLTQTNDVADYGLGVWRVSASASPSAAFSSSFSSPHSPPNLVPTLGAPMTASSSATLELMELNSQGRFGFSPWIDVRRNLIGILSTYTPQSKMQATYKRMKQLLREIIPVVNSPIPSSTSTALPQVQQISGAEKKH